MQSLSLAFGTFSKNINNDPKFNMFDLLMD